MTHLAIAIDGGHSMFKVRAALSTAPENRFSFQIPTVVMHAISLTNEQTRQRAEADTVEINREKYFFGETAQSQSRSEGFTGQNANWVESTQHDVLVLGVWRKVMQAIKVHPQHIHLVMGLPAKYLSAQKEILRQRTTSLLRPYLLPGQSLKVMIQSQADAPLQWLSIQKNGTSNKDRDLDRESWGVIEIGHFTTDFALSERGSMMEYAVSSCPGMHLVYEAVATGLAEERLPTSLDILETAIRIKSVKLYGKPRDVSHILEKAKAGFVATVLDEAERIFGNRAAVMDGIVVGGGGAEVLFTKLREKFPNAISGDDPRMMVAEGFCRLGLLSLSY